MNSTNTTREFLSPEFIETAGRLIEQKLVSPDDPALFVIGESRSGKSTLINAVLPRYIGTPYERCGADLVLKEGRSEDALTGGGIDGLTLEPKQFEGFLDCPDYSLPAKKVTWIDNGGFEDHDRERRMLISLSTKVLADQALNLKLVLTFSYSTLNSNAFIEKLKKRVKTICRYDIANFHAIFIAVTHPTRLRSGRRVDTEDVSRKFEAILAAETVKNTVSGRLASVLLTICHGRKNFAALDPADDGSISNFKNRVRDFTGWRHEPLPILGHSMGQESWVWLAEGINQMARRAIHELYEIQDLKIETIYLKQKIKSSQNDLFMTHERAICELESKVLEYIENGEEVVSSFCQAKSIYSLVGAILKINVDYFSPHRVEFFLPFGVDRVEFVPAEDKWKNVEKILNVNTTQITASISANLVSDETGISYFYKRKVTPEWGDSLQQLESSLAIQREFLKGEKEKFWDVETYFTSVKDKIEQLEKKYQEKSVLHTTIAKVGRLIGYYSDSGEERIRCGIESMRMQELCTAGKNMIEQIEKGETWEYQEMLSKTLTIND